MAVMRLKECPQVQDRYLKASGRVLEQEDRVQGWIGGKACPNGV